MSVVGRLSTRAGVTIMAVLGAILVMIRRQVPTNTGWACDDKSILGARSVDPTSPYCTNQRLRSEQGRDRGQAEPHRAETHPRVVHKHGRYQAVRRHLRLHPRGAAVIRLVRLGGQRRVHVEVPQMRPTHELRKMHSSVMNTPAGYTRPQQQVLYPDQACAAANLDKSSLGMPDRVAVTAVHRQYDVLNGSELAVSCWLTATMLRPSGVHVNESGRPMPSSAIRGCPRRASHSGSPLPRTASVATGSSGTSITRSTILCGGRSMEVIVQLRCTMSSTRSRSQGIVRTMIQMTMSKLVYDDGGASRKGVLAVVPAAEHGNAGAAGAPGE